MRTAVERLHVLWHDELLPEIEGLVSGWELDLEGSLSRARRMWEIHFLVVFPQLAALSLFDEFCRDLFETSDPFCGAVLVQGLASRAAGAAQELWEAAQSGGPTARLRYLERHGGKSDGLVSVSVPSWRDDSRYVEAAIAALRGAPSPAEVRAVQAAERERRLGEARALLASYPRAVREEFDTLLAAAQEANVLHEDHHVAIDEPVTYESRRTLRALGTQLGVGDEVFHLTLDELRAPADHDFAALVGERKAELARHAGQTPPAVLGPTPADDDASADLVAVALAKMFTPATTQSFDDLVVGNPGSPGTARGIVRIVPALADAHALRPGEVLVTETTSPPWTPFFERASAVVTDVGGILSHSAVVAREYGVPAVVGARDATDRLRDGQLVEVDGTAGTVRVVG